MSVQVIGNRCVVQVIEVSQSGSAGNWASVKVSGNWI